MGNRDMRTRIKIPRMVEYFVSVMTDEQAGQLFKMIVEYDIGGEVQQRGEIATYAFSTILPHLERYMRINKKHAETGKKGLEISHARARERRAKRERDAALKKEQEQALQTQQENEQNQ